MPPASPPPGLANETLLDRWTFDPIGGVGAIAQKQRLRGPNRTTPSANPEVWKEVYGYEALTARPSTITTTISEGAVQTLATAMDYDLDGRPATHTYPSPNGANRLQVKRSYTSYGQLASLSNAATHQVYWTANAENAWGHIISESWLTGALTGTHTYYDSTGQSKQNSWFGGGASDQFDYQYNRLGDLTSQSRTAGANVFESYTYDALQRLTGRSGSGGSATYAYTKSGNLTEKSDFSLGTSNAYVYPTGKHGVTGVQLPEGKTATYSYDANGNLIGGNTINATYDAENKLRTINRAYLLSGPGDKLFCNGFDDGTNHCTNPPGGGSTTWTYGTNGERSTEQSSQGTRYFGPHGYELINGVSRHELGPVVVSRTGSTDTVTILLKDRLGSTVDTITGASATLRTFDPFGAARNGNMTQRHNGTLNLAETIHGFTDHTHADDVGLIHMKGRVYDPNLGRFLSVDPISDGGSQGLNPYSYLGNNPLSGTDPTGMYAVDTRSVCAKSFSACSNGSVSWSGTVTAGKRGTSEQPHDRQSVVGPTSQPENKQASDIRDGSRKNTQLAQVEPVDEREDRDETSGGARAEAYRQRGISPAVASAVEASAEREAKEIERTIQLTDPNYKIHATISGLGNNNSIDRLEQAREDLTRKQEGTQFYIENGVRRSLGSREAGLGEIPATIYREGKPPVDTTLRLDQLHSPKFEIPLDRRFLNIQPPIHTPIQVQPLGEPGQMPTVPLDQVRIVPPEG